MSMASKKERVIRKREKRSECDLGSIYFELSRYILSSFAAIFWLVYESSIYDERNESRGIHRKEEGEMRCRKCSFLPSRKDS